MRPAPQTDLSRVDTQQVYWRPLLTGEMAAQAQAVIRAIAADLQMAPIGHESNGVPRFSGEQISLASGSAGRAIFYTYLNQAWPGNDIADAAVQCLEQAIDGVGSLALGPSLYSGFTGVAWTTAHCQGRLLEPDEDAIDPTIDEELLAHLSVPVWQHDYDLVSGLVGMGVYALEHLPHPAARTLLERIVTHLASTAEWRPEGVTWWTNPAWLPEDNRQASPNGYYNLGLAHGVPGIIALLGATCAADVAIEQARPLLDGAVAWLLAQRLPGSQEASFTYWLEPGQAPTPARLAWCYGDLGIAAALLAAARHIGQSTWERAAVDIALGAAARPFDQAGVIDAGLCHGAAGVAHLFNRFYQATGEPQFLAVARAWFAQTLALQKPDCGIAGYQAWEPHADGQLAWVDDPGLLTGAAGIGLALLAATTPVEPVWDRSLLVHIPGLEQAQPPAL